MKENFPWKIWEKSYLDLPQKFTKSFNFQKLTEIFPFVDLFSLSWRLSKYMADSSSISSSSELRIFWSASSSSSSSSSESSPKSKNEMKSTTVCLQRKMFAYILHLPWLVHKPFWDLRITWWDWGRFWVRILPIREFGHAW